MHELSASPVVCLFFSLDYWPLPLPAVRLPLLPASGSLGTKQRRCFVLVDIGGKNKYVAAVVHHFLFKANNGVIFLSIRDHLLI